MQTAPPSQRTWLPSVARGPKVVEANRWVRATPSTTPDSISTWSMGIPYAGSGCVISTMPAARASEIAVLTGTAGSPTVPTTSVGAIGAPARAASCFWK